MLKVFIAMYYFIFGKNFLKGKNNPARLKTIITINGGSNDDCDADGRFKLRATQVRK